MTEPSGAQASRCPVLASTGAFRRSPGLAVPLSLSARLEASLLAVSAVRARGAASGYVTRNGGRAKMEVDRITELGYT